MTIKYPVLFIILMVMICISFIILVVLVILMIREYEEMKKVFYAKKWNERKTWNGLKNFREITFSIKNRKVQQIYTNYIKYRSRSLLLLLLIVGFYILVFISQSV